MTNVVDPDIVDLEPAAWRLAHLVGGVPDELFGGATPCPAYTVGDLVEHIGGLSLAFAAAARKTPIDTGARGPAGDASRLDRSWRTRIPQDLTAMAEAWRDPAAWSGTTEAGGVQLPGEVAGLVALNELVIHGWDVARATGQAYQCDQPSLEAVHAFLGSFSLAGRDAQPDGPFGPAVEVPRQAPLLDRVVGLSGRRPAWAP